MTSPRSAGIADALYLAERRPAVIGENYPLAQSTGIVQPSSGLLYLTSIFIERGEVVTNLIFKTGTTAGSGSVNWWYGLWSHDTAGAPDIPAITGTTQFTASRTSGSPTLTGTGFLSNYKGRLITGTGIPGSTRITEVTSTTITMSANASSGSGTSTTITIGKYAGPRQNIAVTADSTNTVTPTANTFHSKALVLPWTCPGSGLYFAGWMHANSAGAQPNIVGQVLASALGDATINHLAHSNAGPHTTPPGAANPLASVTDVLNRPWVGFS